MRTFKDLCEEKLAETGFREFYEAECHICRQTISIVARLHRENRSIEQIANEIGAAADDIQRIVDADFCKPDLVVRLCRQLGLEEPERCPRLKPAIDSDS